MKTLTRYAGDFRCLNCCLPVSAANWMAGVQHRNHCPFCLFSRHMDLDKAGDRLSACRSVMQPVGLALKLRRNRFASAGSGELMLVHLCLDCGKISLNRIAADDDNQSLLAVLNAPVASRGRLEQAGVKPLGIKEAHLVWGCLYGRN